MGHSVDVVLEIIQMVLHKIAAMPIMVKTLKNLLLRNQESFEAESWYIALGTQDLPSLFNG